MFKSGDKVLMIGVAAIALFFLGWNTFRTNSDAHLTAVITHQGSVVKQIDLGRLNKPDYIHLNEAGIHQVIQAEKGRIRFLESDCPNQTCVKTGWLTKAGDKAVCLPSRVVITIVGGNNQVDVLAY